MCYMMPIPQIFYVISTNYITVNNSYVSFKNDMHFVNKTW